MFWTALTDMDRLRRDMDRVFNGYARETGAAVYPHINGYESDNDITVTAELPGVTKEDVSITFTDDTLTIKGTRKPLELPEKAVLIRGERTTGDFEKTVKIPVKVEAGDISASFEDGVLKVTLPKAEEVKPKTIAIQAK